MSIWEDIKEHPGTIPFFGYPASLEVDVKGEDWPDVDLSKDIVVKITFPKGFANKQLPVEKAAKYFDGEILYTDNQIIVMKADRKIIGHTLMFAFKEHYHKI